MRTAPWLPVRLQRHAPGENLIGPHFASRKVKRNEKKNGREKNENAMRDEEIVKKIRMINTMWAWLGKTLCMV
jgi:hypothetical protein